MRAILSVSDKTGLVELARGLAGLEIELVSTGGTARALSAAGLNVVGVSAVTGFPEMMDGRLKTLHPAVFGGILARRRGHGDLEALAAQGIRPIDVVVVNLYPFAQAAGNAATSVPDLIEQVDIGGPSLVRAAAKNFQDVSVVVDPADYPDLLRQLGRPGGPTLDFRLRLMQKAFAHTAQYDATIAETMKQLESRENDLVRQATPASHGARRPLRYGENPHQKAYWQTHPDEPSSAWQVHQGKELSFTNLLDLDAAVRIALEFTEPAAVVIKHTNPCGVATGSTAADAYVRARDADPLSAFGGIVGLNRALDEQTAKALTSTFIEAVVAPSVADSAKAVLATKQNLRVVTVDYASLLEPSRSGPNDMRSFLGGILLQERDWVVEARDDWPPAGRSDGPTEGIRVMTKRAPTDEEWRALRFAWRVCAHVKSNAVIFTSADRTLAVGAGQMSRVDAVRVAVMKSAAGALRGSVAASDAFFPFRDGLDAVADAGATAVVQPGGSVRDAEVIAAADQRGLAMVFTGRRHFRH